MFAAICLGVAVVIGISVYVGWNLTHPARVHVVQAAAAGSTRFEDVSFPSREDKITIRGWFLPAPASKKTIIFVHGINKNRLQEDVPAMPVAAGLNKAGYNILMFDLRNHGESGGSLTSVGQYEVRDLLGAVDYIKSRGQAGEHIGVMAWSMGAATALNSLPQKPPFEAVVADSSFADLKPYLYEQMSVWTELPDVPFTYLIMNLLPPLTGVDPDQVRPIAGVAGSELPILFIHGDADTAINYKNSQALMKAARNKGSSLWVVHGAEHVKSYSVRPTEYLARVNAFFGRYLADGGN